MKLYPQNTIIIILYKYLHFIVENYHQTERKISGCFIHIYFSFTLNMYLAQLHRLIILIYSMHWKKYYFLNLDSF